MKTIRVTLAGHCEVFRMADLYAEMTSDEVKDYDYIDDLEADGKVGGGIFEFSFMKTIDRLTWREYNGEDDREFGEPHKDDIDIEKRDEDYLEKEYIELGLREPFVVQRCDSTYAEYEYDIELMDNEVFDPMKLRLVISDNEVEFLPCGIITSGIWYDRRSILTISEPCFDPYAESGCFLYEGFGKGRYPKY